MTRPATSWTIWNQRETTRFISLPTCRWAPVACRSRSRSTLWRMVSLWTYRPVWQVVGCAVKNYQKLPISIIFHYFKSVLLVIVMSVCRFDTYLTNEKHSKELNLVIGSSNCHSNLITPARFQSESMQRHAVWRQTSTSLQCKVKWRTDV